MKNKKYLNNIKNKLIVLSIITIGICLFTGFFSLFQAGSINNDGSGSMNVIYSGTIKEVVDNGYSLGYFPFGEKNIRDCFSSDNVTISKLQIAKPGDTAYMVILDLEFKNITDLNKLKGFADMNAKLVKVDNGTEFVWTINSNDRTKLLTVFNFNMDFKSEVISTNGIVKDDIVKWGKTDFSKLIEFSALFKSDLKSSDNKVSENKNLEKKEEVNKDGGKKGEENMDSANTSEKKEKVCGLWGVELPLILLAGLVFYYNRKNIFRK